jgi:hypothetical protein
LIWGHGAPKVKNRDEDEDESHVNWYPLFEESTREEMKTKTRQNLLEMSLRTSMGTVVGWGADQLGC